MELTTDYFELFGLPLSYEVDHARLSEEYRRLQQQYHPDRFANASEQERRISLQMASRLNEGNRVLRDPIARARYMLELIGVDLGTDNQTVRDPAFLMEQMELREALEEAQQGEDPIAALEDFAEQMQQRIAKHGVRFAEEWEDDTDAAHVTMQQMQFFYRLAHQAEAMVDDLI
jgi:molecular chaperone HscB